MKNVYVACHECQLQSLRNYAHPSECNNAKTYPTELQEMFRKEHSLKTPLSIIAEKAFNMGRYKTYE